MGVRRELRDRRGFAAGRRARRAHQRDRLAHPGGVALLSRCTRRGGAKVGSASPFKGAARVAIWGAAAMALTGLVGAAFGARV